jgi:hypothetical protein
MKRIFISEPHEDLRQVLELMVMTLGHEPIPLNLPAARHLASAELLIIEPATPSGAALAQAASIANPSLALICASVARPPAELAELGVVFAASLRRPFTLDQLRGAIEQALRERQAYLRRHPGRAHRRSDDRAA